MKFLYVFKKNRTEIVEFLVESRNPLFIKELTPLNNAGLEIRPSKVLQLTKDSESFVLLKSYSYLCLIFANCRNGLIQSEW